MPLTTKTGFVYESQFDITQHRYVGGDDEGTHGYMELLEIRDAPSGKAAIVVAFWGTGHPYSFWEFRDLEAALAAWGEHWPRIDWLVRAEGCLRRATGPDLGRKPWFYAASGNQVGEDFLATGEGMRYLT